MLAGEITPDVGGGSQELVEGNPTEDEREGGVSIRTPLDVDISHRQSIPKESPQATLDDVGAEALRLRVQV